MTFGPQQLAMINSLEDGELRDFYQMLRQHSGRQASRAVTCLWIVAPALLFWAIVAFNVPAMGGPVWGWVLIVAAPIVLLLGGAYRRRSKENADAAAFVRRVLVARGVAS